MKAYWCNFTTLEGKDVKILQTSEKRIKGTYTGPNITMTLNHSAATPESWVSLIVIIREH
jgi:hypothetical protein